MKSLFSTLIAMLLCLGIAISSANAIGLLNPAEGYVGSDACSTCHASKFQNWQTTLHSGIYREPIPENVISDFSGEVRLSKSSKGIPEVVVELDNNGGAGPFTVTIQGQTYTVDRAHGGREIASNEDPRDPNKAGHARYLGKQRYQTMINGVYYILPIQWNPIPDLDGNNGGWVEYHLEDWFDASGNLSLNPAQNEERRCAGCHQTGVQAAFDDTRGVVVYGAVEENIACEACHGPGAEHIASPSKATMFNPDTDVADINRKNDVCGSCHSRGSSVDSFNGKTLGYPYANGRGYRPGDNVWALYNDGGGYWAGGVSKQHHQQGPDFSKSKHSEFLTCWSCHDPHGSDNEHDLTVTARDNSLCGQCHVDKLASIEEHSGHPASNDASPRCVDCHMSAAQKSAVNYDIHQHTFEVMTPADTLELNQPNACAICHRSYEGTVDGSISAWNEDSDAIISGWLNEEFKARFGDSFVEFWEAYSND